MIDCPLRIVPRDGAPRPAAAWLLPGNDPAMWLEEISRWELPHASLGLLVIPASLGDRSPRGLLVIGAAGLPSRPGPRALPYALLGSRLYVPADAVLEPDALEEEIEDKLPGGIAVFHPAAGLVGFDERDVLRVSALLRLPARRPSDWRRAHPGVPPAPGLRSVEPADPPRGLSFIEEGRDDMGSRPLGEAPAAPGEPGRGMAPAVGRALERGAARAARWITGRAPRSAAAPGWVGRLGSWGESALRSLDELAERRIREIRRLLHLLEREPDEALRFALPLRALGLRGVALQGWVLGSRDADFHLERLGGGGPGDNWSIERDTYAELHRRYREAANRELRLGRFRRAAYIFAELLGDLRGAAGALVEGRHYREAAALYRDHLKDPLAAAGALEKGGLLAEAAEIYLAEKRFESAGDLLARIERRAEAESAYRKAVASCFVRGDLFGAGTILERKVRSADEALGVYASAWPHSGQAKECLEARSDLLGRLGRHEEARSLVLSIRSADLPRSRGIAACEVLARLAGSYPDRECRRVAADTVLVTASRHLDGAAIGEAETLIECVRSTEPRDRLLARDGARYVERLRVDLARARAAAAAALVGRRTGGAAGAARLVRSFRLPGGVDWCGAASAPSCLWCAGLAGNELVVARCTWGGSAQTCFWNLPPAGGLSSRLPMAPCPPGLCIDVRRCGGHRCVELPGFKRLPPCPVGAPDWLPPDPLGLAWDNESHLWTAEIEHSSPAVKCFHRDGKLLAGHVLRSRHAGDVPGDPPQAIVLSASAGILGAGLGRRLFRVRTDGVRNPVESFHLGQEIVAMASSPRPSRHRVAVSFPWGGALVWAAWRPYRVEELAPDLERPLLAFTREAHIVALSRGEGRVYALRDYKASHAGDFRGPDGTEIAVLPGTRSDELAIVTREGSVSIYEVKV